MEDLESLLQELGNWDWGVFNLQYLYSDFHGKFDDEQWQWVCYFDDLGTHKYKSIEDTPSEAVRSTLALVNRDHTRNMRKIRKEDLEAEL